MLPHLSAEVIGGTAAILDQRTLKLLLNNQARPEVSGDAAGACWADRQEAQSYGLRACLRARSGEASEDWTLTLVGACDPGRVRGRWRTEPWPVVL